MTVCFLHSCTISFVRIVFLLDEPEVDLFALLLLQLSVLHSFLLFVPRGLICAGQWEESRQVYGFSSLYRKSN